MYNNTFHLAEHYTPIQRLIIDGCEDTHMLQEEYGESVTECLFLSHLVESLESRSCNENLLSIASHLIDFELPPFQPPELVSLYEGVCFFTAEIVYFSHNSLVSKITTNQLPTLQLLLTVVERRTFRFFHDVHAQSHFEFSAVSL